MTNCVPLQSLCTLITKGTTPNAKIGGFAESGINYVKSECLSYDGNINTTKFVFISEATHTKLRRSILKENDVLVSIAGANLGKSGIVSADMLPANTNQAVAIVRVDPGVANARFVHFVLRDKQFVANNLAGVAQSAQPNLNLADIGRFQIPAWPMKMQLEIAAILGALDDKIELNRKTAATLEEMARALYKSWFVDFDPVVAKSEGRQPAYMDAETAALFPDSFGDDGLPEGWVLGSIADIASLNPQKHTKKCHPDSVRYVDLSNTKWGVIESVSIFDWGNAPSRARMVLSPGDTIVGTVRPANGSYSYISEDGLTGSTGFAVLRPSNQLDCGLVYLATTAPETIEDLANLADGGAYPAVRPEVVASQGVVIAPASIRAAFAEATLRLLESIELRKGENQTLAGLRDTLLPKLMSGELRVGEAKEQVEDVA